jgi:phosphatidylglycerol:prolipoprotein diacylglycerol transferase
MQQVLFRIPGVGIPIYGFGMMLFAAFIICTWMAGRRGEKEGVSKLLIQDIAIWLFLGGLLGARITFLLIEQPPAGIVDFFLQLPKIWDGGIVLYGAVLGALAGFIVAYYLFFRRHGHPMLQLIDILAPAVAVGIALGRIGCFLNGCCYGQVACGECPVCAVHFPLSAPPRYALADAGYQTAAGFTLDVEQPEIGARVGQVEPESAAARAGLIPGDIIVRADDRPIRSADDLSVYLGSYGQWPRGKNDLTLGVADQTLNFRPHTLGLHPTQLYETISMVLLFLVLTAYYPLRTRWGEATAIMMMGYAVHRYLNELLRGDPRPVGFEWVSSLVLFAGGFYLLLHLWFFRPADLRAVPVSDSEVTRP